MGYCLLGKLPDDIFFTPPVATYENHSHKQPAPVTDTFFAYRGYPLTRASTVFCNFQIRLSLKHHGCITIAIPVTRIGAKLQKQKVDIYERSLDESGKRTHPSPPPTKTYLKGHVACPVQRIGSLLQTFDLKIFLLWCFIIAGSLIRAIQASYSAVNKWFVVK